MTSPELACPYPRTISSEPAVLQVSEITLLPFFVRLVEGAFDAFREVLLRVEGRHDAHSPLIEASVHRRMLSLREAYVALADRECALT